MLKIDQIRFKNFKGFEDGFLDLQRLNFLIGANSSGKSSLLKLLLLISQSFHASSTRLFTLKGNLVDMGEKKNIYKNQDYSKEMEFSFHFSESVNTTNLPELCTRAFRLRIRNDLRILVDKLENPEFPRALLSMTINPEIGSMIFCANFLSKNSEYLAKENDSEISEAELPLDYQRVHDALLLSKDISLLNITSIVYSVRNNVEKDVPEIVKIRLFDKDECVFQFRFSTNTHLGVRIYLKGMQKKRIEKYYYDIKNIIKFNSFQCRRKISEIGLNSVNRAFLSNPVGTLFCQLLEKATSPIALTLGTNKVRHVSPLRAYPKKYYIVDGEGGGDEKNDSEAESERMVKLFQNNKFLLETVNEWLRHFGHKIEIQRIHESVYQILEVSKKTKMEITNVGFGLSQILPVLVEPIIANQGDIVIIQQPEIHLHPKAQSILADYFIWVAKTKDITLFIETHSEYLLRRLRRRVAEGASSEAEDILIKPSEVSILSIEKTGDTCQVNKIELNDRGGFKWPKDFMENEIDDMLAYMEINAKDSKNINLGG